MVARSSIARRGKVQKILVREVHRVFRCPKYIKKYVVFCVLKQFSQTREKFKSDYNRKFTYYMVCISYKKNTNKVKQSEVQTDMPQKFNYFMQCKKQHVKNRVKFKQTCPRSSTTSRSASPFAMKAEIMILSFSNLFQNGKKIICVSSKSSVGES